MSNQGNGEQSVSPATRRPSAAVRESEVGTSGQRFVESFPPPPIIPALRPPAVPVATPRTYRVLAACDLSPLSEGVLAEAVSFAHGHTPAELHLVTVVERALDHHILRHDGKRRHLSREIIEELMHDLVWRVGVPKGSPLEDVLNHVALHVCVGEPVAEILRLSRDLVVDLIVVGSHEHQGLNRRLWGSVSKSVMTHADCSVVLSRPLYFAHARRTPQIEPPRPFKTEPFHLQMHHYRA